MIFEKGKVYVTRRVLPVQLIPTGDVPKCKNIAGGSLVIVTDVFDEEDISGIGELRAIGPDGQPIRMIVYEGELEEMS